MSFYGVQEALQRAATLAQGGKPPKRAGTGLLPPSLGLGTSTGALSGVTAAAGQTTAPVPSLVPATSTAQAAAPSPTAPRPSAKRKGGLRQVLATGNDASPVHDRLRATPGTLERAMRQLDEVYAGDPNYVQNRDRIKYRLNGAIKVGNRKGMDPLVKKDVLGMADEIVHPTYDRQGKPTPRGRKRIAAAEKAHDAEAGKRMDRYAQRDDDLAPQEGESLWDALARFGDEDARLPEGMRTPIVRRFFDAMRTVQTPDPSGALEKAGKAVAGDVGGTVGHYAGKAAKGAMGVLNVPANLAFADDATRLLTANVLGPDSDLPQGKDGKALSILQQIAGEDPQAQKDFLAELLGGLAGGKLVHAGGEIAGRAVRSRIPAKPPLDLAEDAPGATFRPRGGAPQSEAPAPKARRGGADPRMANDPRLNPNDPAFDGEFMGELFRDLFGHEPTNGDHLAAMDVRHRILGIDVPSETRAAPLETPAKRRGGAPKANPQAGKRPELAWDDPRLRETDPAYDGELVRSLHREMFGADAPEGVDSPAVDSPALVRNHLWLGGEASAGSAPKGGKLEVKPAPEEVSPIVPAKGEARTGNHYDPRPAPKVANTFDADGNPVYDPTRERKGPAPKPTPKPERPTIPTEADPNVTGLSKAQRTEEATRLGTAKPERVAQGTLEDAHAAGKADVESGKTKPDELVERLSREGRPATAQEYGSIQEGRRRLIQDINAKADGVDRALGTDGHAKALEEYEAAKARAAEFDGHLDRVKGASGGSLNALKIGSTVDEGDFAQALQEARRRNPKGEVSAAGEARLRELTQQVRASDARVAELEASEKARLAQSALDGEPTRVRGAKRTRKARTVEEIHSSRAAATERLKAKLEAHQKEALGRANSAGAVVAQAGKALYDIAPEVVQIAKDFAEEGAIRLSDVTAKVREHVKGAGLELSDDEFHAILTGDYERPARNAPEPAQGARQVKEWRDELSQKKKDEARAKADAEREESAEVDRLTREALEADRKAAHDEAAGRRADGRRMDGADRQARDARREQAKDAFREDADATREAAREANKWKRIAEGMERRRARESATEARKAEAKALSDLKEAARRQAQAERRAAKEEYERIFGERSRLEASIEDLQSRLDLYGPPEAPRKRPEPSADLFNAYRERDRLRKAVRQTIEAQRPKGFAERARTWQRASRLTNPTARVFDVVSNAVVLADRQIGKPIEAALDRVLFGEERARDGAAGSGWSFERARKTAQGAPSRWKEQFVDQMRFGDEKAMRKLGVRDLNGGVADEAINRINRFAGTTDIPFRDLTFEGTLRDLADAKARHDLGADATKEAVAARRDEIVGEAKAGEGHHDLLMLAENEAVEAVFGGDNFIATAIDAAQSAVVRRYGDAGHAGLFFTDMVATFPRVLSNVANYASDFAVGGAKAAGKALVERPGEAGFTLGQRRAINRMAARNLRGLAYMAMGYYAVKQGLLKPKVDDEGRFVDFGDLEQVGGLMSAIQFGAVWAATDDFQAKSGREDVTGRKVGTMRWNAAVGILADQPAIQGPTQFFKTLSTNPGKAAGQKVSGLIPAAIREWAKRQDQIRNGVERRKTAGFGEEMQKNVPFLRERLPDAEGEGDGKRVKRRGGRPRRK